MNTFNPLDYPISLRKPLILHPSAWTQHIPFAMALIDMLRPRVFVELGTHHGTSYCAFCQAVDELKLESQGYAVDTWTGDTHTAVYGPEVLTRLRRHHDPLYSQFSTLLPMTFQSALGQFEDSSIDLLHIDGYHTYEAVKHDFDSWLPKLTDRAVVLFHDIDVRERDFGVWQLWSELKSAYPAFEFTHAHGLGVLAVGSQIPEKLRPLLECPENEASAIREFYCSVGQLVDAIADAQLSATSLTVPQTPVHLPLVTLQKQHDETLSAIGVEVRRQVDWLLHDASQRSMQAREHTSNKSAGRWQLKWSRLPDLWGRLRELSETSIQILTHDGFLAFSRQLYRWLILGERRFRREVPLSEQAVFVYHSLNEMLSASAPTDPAYSEFIRLADPDLASLNLQAARSQRWIHKPSLGVLTVLCDPSPAEFRRTVESMLNQTYLSWTWYLVDAGIDQSIQESAAELAKRDARIIYLASVKPNEKTNMAAALNFGAQQMDQDFIALLDAGDMLAPHALYTVASALRQQPTADVIYSDTDRLDDAGRRCDPLFLPDWSPELLLSFDYLSGFSVCRRTLLNQLGMMDTQIEDCHQWELHFRVSERAQTIHHIREVLAHCRKQPTALRSAEKVITQHLSRLGLADPKVAFDSARGYPLVRWTPSRERKISIVIPSRDHTEILRTCLDSIFDVTSYHNFEVVVVDTGSTDPTTVRLYERYAKHPRFKLVHYLPEFNFGKACNLGAQYGDGELLLFLNNDTEVLQPDWLECMAQWYEIEDIGIVGPKLLYPSGRIQHAGVTVGWNGTGAHLFIHAEEHCTTPFGTDDWYRNLLAVSGACLMISRQAFDSINGFDEEFVLLYSDTQLCISAYQAGYRVVYTPDVRLRHHEASTRDGAVIPRGDLERASTLWRSLLLKGDPYFNPNLSYRSSIPALRGVVNMPYLMNEALMAQIPDTERFVIPHDLL